MPESQRSDLQILPLLGNQRCSPATSMFLSRNGVQGGGCSSTHWIVHREKFCKNCSLHTNLYRCLRISPAGLIYCHMGTLNSKQSLNKLHRLQFTQCFSADWLRTTNGNIAQNMSTNNFPSGTDQPDESQTSLGELLLEWKTMICIRKII